MSEPGSPEARSEKEIFFDALDKDTSEERAAFLDGACGKDPVLRAKVEALLADHFQEDAFMRAPAAGCAQSVAPSDSVSEASGSFVGRYKLLQKLGEGGFGIVYMAEQKQPVKRRVALKVIKLGMDTRQVVARFEAERQALALMDHPNIARVFDGGATETGRPFFVMELVRGIKITEYCDQNRLTTHERLSLFILVCRAIQHAHQKGVIHRDIKPSNILITLHDGVPVPKVIDFGIAKAMQQELTDKTVFTRFEQFIGTPAYISPEQAELSGLDIDTRADIYSLGVLLYELLVGQTPFDSGEMLKDGIDALRRVIREREPTRPSTKLRTLSAVERTTTAQRRNTDVPKLTRLLRGDLDWIVLKCLEKDRNRRYETANGLAKDIERYLADEPVVARPPSASYRIAKTVRRHQVKFTAAALILLVLLLGVSAVILVQHRANLEYRHRLYVSEIGHAGVAWQGGRVSQMLALLNQCPKELRHWEWNFLRAQADLWSDTHFPAATNLVHAALSADGHSMVEATSDGFEILDFPNGQARSRIAGFALASWRDAFALSPTSEQFASLTTADSTIRIWNLRTGQLQTQLQHAGAACGLAWSQDGQQLASAGGGSLRVWNVKSSALLHSIPSRSTVLALAFSPDGRTLAVGGREAGIQLIDVTNEAVKRTLRTSLGQVRYLIFSPDGQRLAMGYWPHVGYQRLSRVWHLGDGESLDLHSSSSAESFAFSSDGHRLLVGDATGMIRLWDLDRRLEIDRVSAHLQGCSSVGFLEDGRILSVGREGKIKIWQTRTSPVARLIGHTAPLRSLAFSPDSRWVASAGINNEVFVWDAQRNLRSRVYSNRTASSPAVIFSPSGRVATASADAMVQAWDPVTLQTDWVQSLAPAGEAWWLAYSPDNRRLFAASADGTVTTLDAATGKPLGAITGLARTTDGLAVSPDGRLLAILSKRQLSVWRADGSKELWHAPGNLNRCAAFSPDGKWIATGGQDRVVTLWAVATEGRVRRNFRGHEAAVSGVAFSPDGERLVSSSIDGVKVWDLSADAELLTLPLEGDGAWHVAFSPDGKCIAAAGGDGTVTLWKTE